MGGSGTLDVSPVPDTQKHTIIAIIGKISPIIACALPALVPEGLDLCMPFGLGTQMVRPNT